MPPGGCGLPFEYARTAIDGRIRKEFVKGIMCDVVAPRVRGIGRSRAAALDVAAIRREAEESIRALACMVYAVVGAT